MAVNVHNVWKLIVFDQATGAFMDSVVQVKEKQKTSSSKNICLHLHVRYYALQCWNLVSKIIIFRYKSHLKHFWKYVVKWSGKSFFKNNSIFVLVKKKISNSQFLYKTSKMKLFLKSHAVREVLSHSVWFPRGSSFLAPGHKKTEKCLSAQKTQTSHYWEATEEEENFEQRPLRGVQFMGKDL